MARVTVEDCLEKIPNRFALTILASRRARALSEGKGTPLVRSKNKVGVVALREIAKGKVRFSEDVDEVVKRFIEEQRAQLLAGSTGDATFIDAAAFGTGDDEDEDEDDDIKELSTDPDKLVEDEDEDEDEEEEEVDEEASDEDEDAVADEDDDAIADEDVDPSVLEGLDDDVDEDEEGDEDEEEDEA